MLLQTNSYIVPKEKRAEHARLMRRFRQVLNGLGCDDFEIFEQVGTNWSNGETTGRFVQIMRFRDRKHQLAVQNAERSDPAAQELIAEFCALVDYPTQQQQRQFAVGFYSSILPVAPGRVAPATADAGAAAPDASPPAETEEVPGDVTPPSVPQAVAPDATSNEPPADSITPAEGPEHTLEVPAATDGTTSHEAQAPAAAAAQSAPALSPAAQDVIEIEEDPLNEEPFHPILEGEPDHPSIDHLAPPDDAAAAPAEALDGLTAHQTTHDDLTDLDVLVEGDLELDDDLSRLANELATREAGDAGAHKAGGGHASENGAH